MIPGKNGVLPSLLVGWGGGWVKVSWEPPTPTDQFISAACRALSFQSSWYYLSAFVFFGVEGGF